MDNEIITKIKNEERNEEKMDEFKKDIKSIN
jgi:hypothetical protein